MRFSLLASVLAALALAGCSTTITFSRAARQFESTGQGHPVMDATGEGRDQAEADLNLVKAAVYGVARDLAQTPSEQAAFESWAQRFFAGDEKQGMHEARKLLSRPPTVRSRVVNARGNVELSGFVEVDRGAIEALLERERVITARKRVLDVADRPSVVLVPTKAVAQARWREMAENVVSPYFSQKKIVVNNQKGFADIDIGGVMQALREQAGVGADADNAVLDALRSDVLAQYDVLLDTSAGAMTATATVRLYETTTGDRLGEGTATSRAYTGTNAQLSALGEALRDAIDQAVPDMLMRWKDYAEDGKPYLLLVRGKPEGEAGRRVPLALRQALRGVCSSVKSQSANARSEELHLRSKKDATELKDLIEESLLSQPGGESYQLTQHGKLFVVDLGGGLE